METISFVIIASIFFIFLIIFLAYLIILILEIYYELIKGKTPFAPTSFGKYKKEFQELFDFLNNLNLKNKKFVDLGSGLGTVVIEFAKRGYDSYGIELNPSLIFLSKLRTRKIKNATFIKEDFFKVNLQNFEIIYVFQLPYVNEKLFPKFNEELQEGSIIVSHQLAFPESDKIKLVKIIGENIFYIYKKII